MCSCICVSGLRAEDDLMLLFDGEVQNIHVEIRVQEGRWKGGASLQVLSSIAVGTRSNPSNKEGYISQGGVLKEPAVSFRNIM